VAVYTNIKPISFCFDCIKHSSGRCLELEFCDFILLNCYFPNSGNKLENLDYRLHFDKYFVKKIFTYKKPIICCGDFNISQTTKDIAEPTKHLYHPGYTIQERESFKNITLKLTDIYRHTYADNQTYTFFSYLGNNFNRNIGYRCDLFLISVYVFWWRPKTKIRDDLNIHNEKRISDHHPITLKLYL